MTLDINEMITDLNAVGLTVTTVEKDGFTQHPPVKVSGFDETKIFNMNPALIQVKDGLPRIRTDLGKIQDLANSLLRFGQLQPIVINQDKQLVAGGRRLAACIIAGIDAKVCYVDAVDPLIMREMELEENIQRKDLTASESILAMDELHRLKEKIYGEVSIGPPKKGKEKTGWSIQKTADLIGKTKASVAEDLILAAALKNFPELRKLETKTEIKSAMKGMEKAAKHMEGLVKYENTIKEAKEFVIVNRPMEDHIVGIPDNTIDLILTDPPYGIDVFDLAMGIGGETGSEHTTTGITYEDNEAYAKELMVKLACQSYRVTKDTGHAYIFCAPSHFWWLKEVMTEVGWNVRERPIVWIKRESGQNNQPSMWPSSAYEFILFARKPNARLVLEGRVDWIQVDPVGPGLKVHPAEKPVMLLKELISRTTLPGQYMLDPFMGSGSSIEAAASMKVLGIGSEKDITAYAAAVTRLQGWKDRQVNV